MNSKLLTNDVIFRAWRVLCVHPIAGWFGKLGKQVAALHPSQPVSGLKLGKLSRPPLLR
jgi:hypothetical protein